MLSLVGPATSYWLVGPALLLIGLGIGAAFVPSTDAVMAAVPGENAGLGSAINDSGRQVGAALGIGILGALANAGYRSGIGGTGSSLSPDLAATAKRSVGAALQMAAGSADPLERRFGGRPRPRSDGFGLAMLAGAVLLAAGAAAVLRWLPSRDVAAHPAEAEPSSANRRAGP